MEWAEDRKRESDEAVAEARKRAALARQALADAREGHAARVRAVGRAERAVNEARKALKRAAKWAEVAGGIGGPEARKAAQDALDRAKARAQDAAADLAKTQKELADGAKAAPSTSPAEPTDPGATATPGSQDGKESEKPPKDGLAPADSRKPKPPPEPPDKVVKEGPEVPCGSRPPGALYCGNPPECPVCEKGYECEGCEWVPVPSGPAKGKADVGAGALPHGAGPYNPSMEYGAAMPSQTEAGFETKTARVTKAKPEHWSAKVPPSHPRVKVPPNAAGADLRAVPEAAVAPEASSFGPVAYMGSPNISPAFWSVVSNVVPLFVGDAVVVFPGGPPAGGQPPKGPGGGGPARPPVTPADTAPQGGAVQPKPYVKELNRLHDEIQRKMEQEKRAEFSLLLLEMSGDFRQVGVRDALLILREERYALQAKVREIEEQHGVAFPRKSATDRLIDEALLFFSTAEALTHYPMAAMAQTVGRVFQALEGMVFAGVVDLAAGLTKIGEMVGLVDEGLSDELLRRAAVDVQWAASQFGLMADPGNRIEAIHSIAGGVLKAVTILAGGLSSSEKSSLQALAEGFLREKDPLEDDPSLTAKDRDRLRTLRTLRLIAYLLASLAALRNCVCPEGKSSGGGWRPAPRPKGVPENWTVSESRSDGGTVFRDPSNVHNSVRVMPGDPSSPYPNSRGPYVRVTRNGQYLDNDGNVVSRTSAEGHIPLAQFKGLRE